VRLQRRVQGHAHLRHLRQLQTTHTASSRAHTTPNRKASFPDLRITRSASRILGSRVREKSRCLAATTGQAHCLRRHQAQDRKVSHERGAIPILHCGALNNWHEYNKEIKSKVIRCECSKDTGRANANSRAELSEPGRPPCRQRCRNLVLEGDGRGVVHNDIGRVCLFGQRVGTKSCQTDTYS
jgi:hypothetical protein